MKLTQPSAGKDLKNRFVYLGLAIVLGLLVIAVRLYRLQITNGDEYTQKSVANFAKEVRDLAYRGLIKDAKGEILAENRPSFDVLVTPAFCERCEEEVLPHLGELLNWDADSLTRAVGMVRAGRKTKFQAVPVRIDLTRDELDLVNAHRLELPGVEIAAVSHRSYRESTVLSHVLGYMNEITQDELEKLDLQHAAYGLGDFIGRRGLERSFENQLRGTNGLHKEVVDARGRPIPELNRLIEGVMVVPPQSGKNLILSIDMRLQAEAEKAFPGTAGVVVVVEVNTGFILAVVSRPGFDPNLLTGRVTPTQLTALSKDPLQPMIFRASQQHYSPGSTFKIVTALTALKSGLFPPHNTVFCPGGYRLGSRFWRCHLDRGHGYQDARQALQHSCDTYYYKVADTLGLDPIHDMGASLGLGEPTGIGVVAEVPGIMPSTEYHNRRTPGGYTKGMALNSAIGQGDVNVTPLQLAMVYATVANGGNLYRPQLVRRIESQDGKVEESFGPQLVRKLAIDPEQRRIVVDALTAVVNEAGGTAYRARLENIKMAGKTGTAQVVTIGKIRVKKEQMDFFERDHAWFAGFAPAENPEIAIVVLNEHGGHGGVDAAPTATAVVKKYFELKELDAHPPEQAAAPAPETGGPHAARN